MANEGDLVKMENGRWARFQRCKIDNAGHQEIEEMTLLVAVELDEHYQQLLDSAEDSLGSYRERGVPVQVRLDPDSRGKVSLRFEQNDAPSAH